MFYIYLMLQSAIDIFEGLTDEQAMEMAKNLEFKGEQQNEVLNHTLYFQKWSIFRMLQLPLVEIFKSLLVIIKACF